MHLARVLAVEPDMLLLDEPFAGLDAEVRAALLEDALSALRSDTRATLVVVHDRAEAWALADRLLILIDGRLVADGSPRDLLEHPPSPGVARFLGYDGAIRDGDETCSRGRPTSYWTPAGPLEAHRHARHGAGGRLPARAHARRPDGCTRWRRCRPRASATRCACAWTAGSGFPGAATGPLDEFAMLRT